MDGSQYLCHNVNFQQQGRYLTLDEDPVLTVDPLRLCANRKEMEEKIELAMAGRENINGGEPTVTEEDLKTLRILLEDLEPMPDDNDPLYKIVFAETKPYFSGDKTVDDIIDVIQNRATLYMTEK